VSVDGQVNRSMHEVSSTCNALLPSWWPSLGVIGKMWHCEVLSLATARFASLRAKRFEFQIRRTRRYRKCLGSAEHPGNVICRVEEFSTSCPADGQRYSTVESCAARVKWMNVQVQLNAVLYSINVYLSGYAKGA